MKKKSLTSIFTAVVFLLTQITTQHVYAQGFFEVKEPPRAAEYIYRSSPKESLIGVQLLGAVKNPGLYYIPSSTDLLKLVTLAGGTDEADLSSIVIRKTEGSQKGVYEVDLNRLMKTTSDSKPLNLAQDDFIYIPKKEPWISNDVSRTITIVSLVATIILTGVLIQKNSD
ncbi:MAG: polysaccharide biosynthesis/export family protein [Pseudobdellovibrio sp.]